MQRYPRLLKLTTTILASVVLSYVISFVSDRINILEKFTIAINDIDFTDLYYQYRPKPAPDQHITLVNIGYRDRSELAAMLKIISQNNPKVIGGDIFFTQSADVLDEDGTERLSNVVRTMDNLVLASSYLGKTANGLDSMERQSTRIRDYTKEGIVNLNIATDDPEYGTVRSFKPITDINGTKHPSFSFLVASLFDPTVMSYASEDEMMIRWYGYGNRNEESTRIFKTLDWDQVLNGEFDKKDMEGKIVLVGFLGRIVGDHVPEDIFFTPLNRKIVGRSIADMYGLEVHANIIKMIIEKDFIHHSRLGDFIVNLSCILLFTLALFWLHSKYNHQYSILSKIALILFVDLLILLAIGSFSIAHGNIKFLIADGLLIMLFLPDTYEFLETNFFNRIKR